MGRGASAEGGLTFDDEQIEQVRDLCKNGHYLRYFGAQNMAAGFICTTRRTDKE
ncbi:hypothetical protein GCM10007362_34040 [Saccharibacillus endophyticus]|uniref:Uncharacterized protein n=1 Tax=Saccharibacillus endophyticus TaxID=2060666 RepID=A0ABQ1ZZF6_9BACL|nr:hypothetical protein GCM10007362_34040 [Saccharibacillus endophyticus]